MKPLFLTLLAAHLALAPALAAAGDRPMPPPQAPALWDYITKTSPYTKWSQWPDYSGVRRSRSPHGPYNQVYANQAALRSTKAPLNYGAIQVKASQTEDGKLKDVLVMYKAKGYSPKTGDWFWAMYTPQGRPLAAGKPAGCIRCHSAMGDNDYVLAHQFR
ncbi:MAG: cytochrome P460 family protein [Desulfarculus sp.]|nr:cytochrome P460 family protein [Pseudomonadota bacterium]MBV1717392.1 cytochrome P460 family protein [Desulfarculus sp.]MBU4573719.1 cytochrome P460 family protein [Pseudomonadota bacterium]MBU4598691.1 cytochrome P460 family protein [Pseudomonadota bacterium]MBV1739962.1 cytochrome P460 family protein [Desulfarculus sp.]